MAVAKRAHPKFVRKREGSSGVASPKVKIKRKKAAGSSKVVARFLSGLRSEGIDLVAKGQAQSNVPLIVQRQLKKALAGYVVVSSKRAVFAVKQTKEPINRLVGPGIPKPSEAELDFATKSEVAAILKRPDMVTAEELAERVGTTKETINQWRKSSRVIGVAGAKRGFRYPLQQLNQFSQPYEVIPEILRQLDGDHWAAWRFLLEKVSELGMTGFEALARSKTGRLLAVLEARSYGSFS